MYWRSTNAARSCHFTFILMQIWNIKRKIFLAGRKSEKIPLFHLSAIISFLSSTIYISSTFRIVELRLRKADAEIVVRADAFVDISFDQIVPKSRLWFHYTGRDFLYNICFYPYHQMIKSASFIRFLRIALSERSLETTAANRSLDENGIRLKPL
jgi:hypothetical protein